MKAEILRQLGLLSYEVFAIMTGSSTPRAIADGEAMAASRSFWLLMALPGLWFVAEVLTMLTNERRRALHDFIAGTVVVRTDIEEEGVQPSAPPNADLPAARPSTLDSAG